MKSLSLSQPHLIIMVGVPGSGKTFFAEKFAETFQAPYLHEEKIRILGETSPKGAESIFLNQLDELLKTKRTVVIEGSSSARTERMEISRRAREADYIPLFIWVQTDLVTAKARSLKEKDGMDSETFDKQVKRFTPLSPAEKSVVISGKHTYASQAKVVLKKLSSPRAEISTHDIAPLRPEQPNGRRNITVR